MKLPRTSTVSLMVFISPFMVHLPPFRCDNLGADVHMVPSAVTSANPLFFGLNWVPVPVPAIDSPFLVTCKYSCLEFIQTSNCHGGFMYMNKLYKRMHLLFPCINGLIGTWSLSIFSLVNISAGNFGINEWYINKIIIISWFYLKQYSWDNTTCKYTR